MRAERVRAVPSYWKRGFLLACLPGKGSWLGPGQLPCPSDQGPPRQVVLSTLGQDLSCPCDNLSQDFLTPGQPDIPLGGQPSGQTPPGGT